MTTDVSANDRQTGDYDASEAGCSSDEDVNEFLEWAEPTSGAALH